MKYHIEKNTVQETLIIPLFGRLVCSERFPKLFSDPAARRICDSLDYDFAEKRKKMESPAGLFGALEVAQRQYDLQWEVKAYLEDEGALGAWSNRFASVTAKSYMRGYRDIYRDVSLFHKLMIRFCDSLVNMKIVKIVFSEGI